jgi:hypothetical protein
VVTSNLTVASAATFSNAAVSGALTATGVVTFAASPVIQAYTTFNSSAVQTETVNFNQIPNAITPFTLPSKGGNVFIVYTHIGGIGSLVGVMMMSGPYGGNYTTWMTNGSPYCGSITWNGGAPTYNASGLGGVNTGNWGIRVVYVPLCPY